MKLPESIQRRSTVKDLEGKMYEKHLKSLGSFSPEKRKVREDIMAAYSSSQGEEGQS